MKRKTSFFLFLLAVGLYFFLFPFPLTKETTLIPVWVKDLSEAENTIPAETESVLPFILETLSGLFRNR